MFLYLDVRTSPAASRFDDVDMRIESERLAFFVSLEMFLNALIYAITHTLI
jgi:hypothetical protein